MDLHQLGAWLFVSAIFVLTPVLAYSPFARRIFGERLIQLGAYTVERLSPVAEPDEFAIDLAKVRRRERLCSDVERLQRTVATDMWMSATRQIANRLAYAWVLRDLEASGDLWQVVPTAGAITDWSETARPIQTSNLMTSRDSRSRNIETLEL